MRIVAGKYRRRKLHANPGRVTRPLTDRVKEMLFERLGQDIEGKRVADIFSGTGTAGLEALSRGATGVVFVENDHRAFDLLKKNVEMLGVENEVLCWRTNALTTSFRPNGVDHLLPFDTILFDPPYEMIRALKPGSPLYKSLERLARDDVSSPEALLVLRTPQKADFECPPCWQLDKRLSHSSMQVQLLQKRPADC